MAQEGSEASVASSPPPPPASSSSSSWWRDMHPAAAAYGGAWPPPPPPAARWPPMAASSSRHHHQQQQQQHGGGRTTSSGGADDDDLSASNATMTSSFTNTSATNRSGLSMDDSGGGPAEAAAAAESHHLWNQVLIMGAGGGEVGRSMHDAHDDSENFLELLNSRTLVPELFADPPACDYLKKMEYGSSHGGGWPDHHQFTTAAALEKHLSSGYGGGALAHQHQHQHAAAGGAPERLTANLSDLVSNWSIAPPNPCLGDAHHHHRAGVTAACDNDNAKAGMFLGSGDGGGVCKHEIGGHGAMLEGAATGGTGGDQEFLRPAAGAGYSSMLGLSRNNRTMYMEAPWGSNAAGATRSLSDLISFGGAPLGKAEEPAPPTSTKAQAEYKKQGHEIPSPAKTSSGDGSKGSSEGKKKRSEQQQGSSEGNTKKSKSEVSSPTSSLKASSQVPKVKLGDKITALQQIVSPFGKTDTASVLYEAINYIKWLHEQVQLLSDPYMKTSSKDYNYNAWGRLEDKEGAEMVDLRSRGLCLVPVSCTPQAYRDSNDGPDYWTPPYRSCLYR